MRQLLLILWMAIYSASLLPAQNYPFPTADAEWVTTHVSNYCIGGSNIYYLWREYLGADTLIQGNTYQRVLLQPECQHVTTGTHCTGFDTFYPGGPITVGAIREENKQVFFQKFDLPDALFKDYETALKKFPAGEDVLLFDFNLTVGDTMIVSIHDASDLYFEVTDDENWNGRKCLTLTSLDGIGYSVKLTEGAGADLGLFGLYYSPAMSYYLPLGTCFYHMAEKILSASYCSVCGVVDTGEPVAKARVSIFPNPAQQVLHIEADPSLGPFLLQVFDLQGHFLFMNPDFPGSANLSLHAFPKRSWIQVLLVAKEGQHRWTERIWVE